MSLLLFSKEVKQVQMLVLTLLGLIHVACSNDIGRYVYGVKPLADFDEVDPIDESQPGRYETISPMELKRLPRKVDGILNHHIHGLKPEVPMVQNENNMDGVGFDEVKNKVQSQNLKKVGASLSTRKPFLASKKYFGERDFFHSPATFVDINVSFKIIATPYTRSKWEPNFLRTVIE